jgi:hypothetical protein
MVRASPAGNILPRRARCCARELSFIHPRRKKLMTFEAPLLDGFLAALKLLRQI